MTMDTVDGPSNALAFRFLHLARRLLPPRRRIVRTEEPHSSNPPFTPATTDMPPTRPLRIVLPLALIALVVFLASHRASVTTRHAGSATAGGIQLPTEAADSGAEPSTLPGPAATSRGQSVNPAPATAGEPAFLPGHFPGVSTRHVPGPDPRAANDPPAGVPHEVTLKSGEKLIRTLTDERDAVPLMPSSAR